jgi:hypothetical protein
MTRPPQGWITALAIVAAVLGAVVQQCAPVPVPEPPECEEPERVGLLLEQAATPTHHTSQEFGAEWAPLYVGTNSTPENAGRLISNVQVYDEVLPAVYMTTTTTADRRTSEPMPIDEKIPLVMIFLSLVGLSVTLLWSAYRGKI